MIRESTKKKYKVVIEEFLHTIKEGVDYEIAYIYKKAGEPAFLSNVQVAFIIKEYYRKNIITKEMINFVDRWTYGRPALISEFSDEFNVGQRESRYIISLIKWNKK